MKYILRLLWFIVSFILGLTALVGACMLGYNIAQASGNVYVIATEGMQVRAANILMPGDKETGDLTKYFTSEWIGSDTEIKDNAYKGDLITDFDHRVTVESIWAQPWSGKATVTLVETVNTITGDHPTGDIDESGNAVTETCAPWEKRRYKVNCIKLGNRWYIDSLDKVDVLPPDPTPTKEPVLSTVAASSGATTVKASPSPTPTK